MQRIMLDTNIVSHLLRGHASATRHLLDAPISALCISAITEGELRFGLARRPQALRLQQAVQAFLKRVDVMPWSSEVAACYSALRARMSAEGRTLAPLDMLIAAHALALQATLVTGDRAFAQVPGLQHQDWLN